MRTFVKRFRPHPTSIFHSFFVPRSQFGYKQQTCFYIHYQANMSENDRKLFESIGLNPKLVNNLVTSKSKVEILKTCIHQVCVHICVANTRPKENSEEFSIKFFLNFPSFSCTNFLNIILLLH